MSRKRFTKTHILSEKTNDKRSTTQRRHETIIPRQYFNKSLAQQRCIVNNGNQWRVNVISGLIYGPADYQHVWIGPNHTIVYNHSTGLPNLTCEATNLSTGTSLCIHKITVCKVVLNNIKLLVVSCSLLQSFLLVFAFYKKTIQRVFMTTSTQLLNFILYYKSMSWTTFRHLPHNAI